MRKQFFCAVALVCCSGLSELAGAIKLVDAQGGGCECSDEVTKMVEKHEKECKKTRQEAEEKNLEQQRKMN